MKETERCEQLVLLLFALLFLLLLLLLWALLLLVWLERLPLLGLLRRFELALRPLVFLSECIPPPCGGHHEFFGWREP